MFMKKCCIAAIIICLFYGFFGIAESKETASLDDADLIVLVIGTIQEKSDQPLTVYMYGLEEGEYSMEYILNLPIEMMVIDPEAGPETVIPLPMEPCND
jgi:hypothetical protein